MKEIFGGQHFDLFLSDEDYVIKDKNGKPVFYSPKWVSNYRKLKDSINKLSELGEKNGRPDLIAEQINSTLDIYTEDEIINSSFVNKKEGNIKNEIAGIKIKRKMSADELNRMSKDLSSDHGVIAISDNLYKKMKHLLSESFDSEYTNKVLNIFKNDLFAGLVYITEDIKPVAIVDRNPGLKDLCQKIIQSYYGSEDSSSFEKSAEEKRYQYINSSYVPYRVTSNGEGKFFLEKKSGQLWKTVKASDSSTNIEMALRSMENKEQDKKDKKEMDKEEKKAAREQKKIESRDRKIEKKRSKSWSKY